MTWDDLQQVKHDVGRGDKYAIEIFPRDVDVVNVWNLRHLWVFDECLEFGWFMNEDRIF